MPLSYPVAMPERMHIALPLALGLLLAGAAPAQTASADQLPVAPSAPPASMAGWYDDAATRTKAAALLNGFNATLLSEPSATRVLTRWCAEHRLAEEPRIRALRIHQQPRPASAEVRALLQVASDEALGYRRVQLACGALVLSEADNWYVPSRLSSNMNQQLEHTDTPFGLAVQALAFRRQTQQVEVLWRPLPELWEMQPVAAPASEVSTAASRSRLEIPPQVLRHRAVLLRGDGQPFSVVVETYTDKLFAFDLQPQQAPR